MSAKKIRFSAEQEMALMRLPYSHKARDLLPKYALFNAKRSDFGKYLLPSHYGKVVFVFKDAVKRRATWTYVDSLVVSESGIRTPDNFPPRTTRFSKSASGECYDWSYCESKIWGSLSLEDVAYVMIEKETGEISEDLKALNLPVYWYSKLDAQSGANEKTAALFKRGQLALEGDPAKIPVPKQIDLAASTAVRNILSSRELGSMSSEVLLEELKKKASNINTNDSSATFELSRFEYLLAELASRKKTPDVEVN